MRVGDWMTPEPVCVAPDTTIAEARTVMRRGGVRHLPVVDRGRLVGIISDRDVTLDAQTFLQMARDPVGEAGAAGEPVSTVMSRPVETVREDESLEAVTHALLRRRVGAIPVLDETDAVVGIVSATDLLDLLRIRQTLQVPADSDAP